MTAAVRPAAWLFGLVQQLVRWTGRTPLAADAMFVLLLVEVGLIGVPWEIVVPVIGLVVVYDTAALVARRRRQRR